MKLETLVLVLMVVDCISSVKIYPARRGEDYQFWMQEGRREIDNALKRLARLRGEDKSSFNLRRPKNVVIFIGDGMSITTTTASRIYYGQQRKGTSGEDEDLIWDTFPETALLKTYNVDRQTPDSAGTATAYFSGVKTNMRIIGYDATAKSGSGKTAEKAVKATSILEWAQNIDKKTGFVTTTRLTHATPSALYAHAAHRDWECDAGLKRNGVYGEDHLIAEGEPDPDPKIHKDIAMQMIKGSVGRRANVILGGGLRSFKAVPGVELSKWTCVRQDGRDLIQEWLDDHETLGHNRVFVNTTGDLLKVDFNNVDRLLGVFSNSHLPYDHARDTAPDGQPSLSQMTTSALNILTNNDGKGFVLAVEGGRIDHAHHANYGNTALDETVAFDKTIRDTIDYLKEKDMLEETLIIVTADHSHVFTMAGYPERGTDIRGTTGKLTDQGINESILGYANGQGVKNVYPETPNEDGKCARVPFKDGDMKAFDYRHPSTVYDYDEHHGGDDVGLWAIGPMSYLFHKNHEQSYVAHVIGYSMCMGPYQKDPECRKQFISNNGLLTSTSSVAVTISAVIFVKLLL